MRNEKIYSCIVFHALNLYTANMLVGHRHFERHTEDDEEIIAIIHKHWMLGFKYLLYPCVGLAFTLALFFLAPYRAVFYIAAMLSIGMLIWGLRNFYDYYLDAWIITNQGIIDVEWHGWFHRQSTRVLYSDINGVSYEIQGIVGTILKYGVISVEKISTGSVFSMESVKSPRAVEGIILSQMENYLHAKNLTDARHVQEVLSQIVAREVGLEQFDEEEGGEELDEDDPEYYDEEEDDEYYDDDD